MVCEKCEAKLSKVSAPNPWRTSTAPAGGRKINENKALSSARERYNPIGTALAPCRICRQKVHQMGAHYCQACAYKKAICAMCGKKIMNTKNYKQSST
ncbi:cysteine-rich PDZ-binding protein [Drosophila suzukii]|uniref:Cysteine-rich PDZ-binding protein n=1 Tax=Drosophila suzukii TaxID=28584 RepID=A0AB39YY03_DROSZ|nr:cysteine-rich PDZ-binding protein [Drosophila suzukii]XP_016962049.1 cysteine-rich PDZ-binding protein [Drosophila biarmipes]XP_016998522.1 cysteine-rich PDZ-binding protein [Drosophila takahashii]XP_017075657.1 cysteine-rich PDZ-binding protein [Drosophila eugracilis]XP_017121283.1 cysteine-rich PDZ-binding protein [Drosophila elegans]XP_037711337.1 cysteine-rich PDZ-binding protein [Drosophila subpulchrella]XP_052851808.1 cysteine-rich PDZ-binding protein [Drosophila gunungcola]